MIEGLIGADFLAALVERCFRGALAPVLFLAVYFVLAIKKIYFKNILREKIILNALIDYVSKIT